MNLIKRRKELNLTQEELARKAGVSRQSIYMIEHSKTANMTVATLKKVCSALDCDLNDTDMFSRKKPTSKRELPTYPIKDITPDNINDLARFLIGQSGVESFMLLECLRVLWNIEELLKQGEYSANSS